MQNQIDEKEMDFVHGWNAPSGGMYPPIERIYGRALVNRGNSARIEGLFGKAEKGEEILIAVIGGSITEGAKASCREKAWGRRLADWWEQQFPMAKVRFLNVGIGATGSLFAVYRLAAQLLSKKPDFVGVEFSVNDKGACGDTYEGVIRQLLSQPQNIAVMGLHMVNSDGMNAEQEHLAVLRHYGIPAVSYRAALWTEIEEGRLAWRDLSPDEVHPMDIGHAYAAELVIHYLENALADYRKNGKSESDAEFEEVSPLHGRSFDHGEILDLSKAEILENKGFVCEQKEGWGYYGSMWTASEPGARLVMAIEAEQCSVLYPRLLKPYGHTRVSVDGEEVAILEGFHNQTWGYTPIQELFRGKRGRHVIEFDVLAEKDPLSDGYGFELRAVMRAW